MSQRDEAYQRFGPLLLEALIDSMLEEVNELRALLNLPTRTKEGFLGRSNNNQNHLDPYDWMG